MVAEAHGNGDDRARFHFRAFVNLREETRIFRRIGDDDDFAGLRDPAGESLAEFDADIFESFSTYAGSDLKIELTFVHVHEQKRPGIRTENFVDFLHDGAQNLIELQGRGKSFAKFVENSDFRGLRGFRSFWHCARSSAPFDAAEGLAVIRPADRFSRQTWARVWGLVGQL